MAVEIRKPKPYLKLTGKNGNAIYIIALVIKVLKKF